MTPDRDKLRELVERWERSGRAISSTHYTGCGEYHAECLMRALLDALDAAEKERDALQSALNDVVAAGARIEEQAAADSRRGVLQMTGRGDVMYTDEWQRIRALATRQEKP